MTTNRYHARQLSLPVGDDISVSALLQVPRDEAALLVLAHGAGAGMTHPFMTAMADGLAERAIATLRYQFPYMERGSKRPDPPQLAQATVRAAVTAAAQAQPKLPLFAGGKSFGGRMTSQTQAASLFRRSNSPRRTASGSASSRQAKPPAGENITPP